MKESLYYDFSVEKNCKLIDERGISFEEVIAAIENGQLLDIMEHHDSEKYPGQQIYVVQIGGYAYLVPFVQETSDRVFLKTIIPSRKAKRRYSV